MTSCWRTMNNRGQLNQEDIRLENIFYPDAANVMNDNRR